jgi:hypothetical protein
VAHSHGPVKAKLVGDHWRQLLHECEDLTRPDGGDAKGNPLSHLLWDDDVKMIGVAINSAGHPHQNDVLGLLLAGKCDEFRIAEVVGFEG